MSRPNDLVQGTLDLLVLRTLALGPMHGWRSPRGSSKSPTKSLQVQQGSLYPALHRLEQNALISAEWAESENNRKAKFYSLTQAGKQKLEEELAQWDRLSSAINLVIREA